MSIIWLFCQHLDFLSEWWQFNKGSTLTLLMRPSLYPKSHAPSFISFSGAELQVNMPKLETCFSSGERYDMANKADMFLREVSMNRLFTIGFKKKSCMLCHQSLTVMWFHIRMTNKNFPSTVALISNFLFWKVLRTLWLIMIDMQNQKPFDINLG